MADDTLILMGTGIKALGNGRVGGYLVRYTDENSPDLELDFFTKATDFDVEDGDRVTVYYNHGLDPAIGLRKIGRGTLKLTDDVGVWVEAQLNMRDEYERAIYAMAEEGALGWSSGTAPHLVERVPVKSSYFVKSWPLGKDASLTPTPAAGPGLTSVTTLKAWRDSRADIGDGRKGGEDPRAGTDESGTKPTRDNTLENTGDKIMSEFTKADIAGIVAEAMAAERKAADEKAAKDAADQARIAEAVKAARAQWEKEAAPANDRGYADGGAPAVIDANDRKYDNVETGDLAVVANVVANAHKKTYRQLNPNLVRAMARRLESDEALKSDGLRTAGWAMKSAGIKANETNFSTNASYGDEWIGVAYSGALWESIRLNTFVVDRLNPMEFPAGAESMFLPLESTDPIWYLVAQAGDPSSGVAQVTNTVTAAGLGSNRVQMTLGKLGSATIWTGEMSEDAVLPFANQLRKQIAVSGAEYLEAAIIDGDTDSSATTNINDIAGTPAATDWFLIWNGFRKSCLVTTTANSRDGGTLASNDFLETVKLMGAAKFAGMDRDKVSFIVDPSTHYKSLELADVKSRDVFGGATIESGRLSSIYGYEVLVSGQMHKASANRLVNTAGKVDQDTTANNTTGSILAVRWDQWAFAFRRRMTQEVERIPRADAWEITTLLRAGLLQRDTEASAISYNLTV